MPLSYSSFLLEVGRFRIGRQSTAEVAGKTSSIRLWLFEIRLPSNAKEMDSSQMIFRSAIKMVFLLFSVFALCDVLSGQEFDESFELWPVDLKINGTVITGGGSELPNQAAELLLAVSMRAEAPVVRVQLPKVRNKSNAETTAKFDELEKASDNLRKTGYYKHWPKDYYEGTVLKRQSYRRYRNARNEKKSQAKKRNR